jgi:hypothetical protein
LGEILNKISVLTGGAFENLAKAILSEAGFLDVVKQTAGNQDGFDIRAYYQGKEWRFEAKKTKGDALDEKELAVKFDQIERNPGDTEYFILLTNTNLTNNLRNSIEFHRCKWIIDISYWSLCNAKFINLLLSYPKAVIKQLNLPIKDADKFLTESQKYLNNHNHFLLDETDALLKTSNRLALLQNIASIISKRQIQNVRPTTTLDKLVHRITPHQKFDQFRRDADFSCFFLIAKEQIGKSSLMQLWASSIKEANVVFFFTADNLCRGSWLNDFQLRISSEIERLASGKQYPEYLSTFFDRLQPRLKAHDSHIYMFVDALNAAPYEDVRAFFMSEDFRRSISEWRVNWIFSCRESTWNEWRNHITIPNMPLEYNLKEFEDDEIEAAAITHHVDLGKLPNWLRLKLKHPGMLRLCSILLSKKPDAFYEMPEMKHAEISLMFLKERLDEFSNLYPGGEPLSFDGVQKVVNEVVALFSEQQYDALPFEIIKEKNDLDPHKLSSNSWNILLQQGFLTKNQESYELGNDWATILIGKYLIDTCLRSDIKDPQKRMLLDQLFDGIAPITVDNRVSIEDTDKFIEVLWFSLHYGKICGISQGLFRMIMERVFAGQNLAHRQLSEVAAKLFPKYSVQYLASRQSDHHGIDLYIREGLEKARSEEVIPEIIKYFPHVSKELQLQMAILFEHYRDARYLEDIYLMMDQLEVEEGIRLDLHVGHKIDLVFGVFPDESNKLIERLFTRDKIKNLDYAIGLLGWNGDSAYVELLRNMIKQQAHMSVVSLRAMGRLRLPEVEEIAMKVLTNGSEKGLQYVAIEALGYIQSALFLQWCKEQKNIWEKDFYQAVAQALQGYILSDAYDLLISYESNQGRWIPYIFFYEQNRHRRLSEDQIRIFIEGIIHKIQNSTDENTIWRGFHNLTSLNLEMHRPIWRKYQDTDIPIAIAGLVRFCAKPDSYVSRGQTEASAALENALRILDWIEDKKVIIPLLKELMEAEIPRLFAWTLFPYVAKYADESHKEILIKLAVTKKSDSSTEKDIYDLVQNKAIICLTHLKGDDVAKIILEHRTGWVDDKSWKYLNTLDHFKSESLIKYLVDAIKRKNIRLFWSAYCFLWEFKPIEVVEPVLEWLKDEKCEKWIREYLLRLLSRYDIPACNKKILEYLNDSAMQNAAVDVAVYSKDSQIQEWFKRNIREFSSCPIIIANEDERVMHAHLILWARRNNYKEAKTYLEKWLASKERLLIHGFWLLSDVYELIGKFEFWDLFESVKNKYSRASAHERLNIAAMTLELVFKQEPDWAWSEFIKLWSDLSNAHRKDMVKWVAHMASDESLTWLLSVYFETGNFFSDEKEIRKSITQQVSAFPNDVQSHAIQVLKVKAASPYIANRLFAACCCGLFGNKVYNEFTYLASDGSERVRHMYQYAELADENLIVDL